MERDKAELVINWYLDLEDRLQGYLKTVPIYKNYDAVLPLLSSIIMDAGGLLDSVFREEFDLSKTDKDSKNLKFNDFSKHYEERCSLSTKTTLPYIHPPHLMKPFLGFDSEDKDFKYTLKWWTAYNNLKHDRINNDSECTLNNAINSLCALHQILSSLPCFFRSLIAHDMVCLKGYSIKWSIDKAENDDEYLQFLVETELFATPWGQLRFPEEVDYITGAYFGGSQKLERFLGK